MKKILIFALAVLFLTGCSMFFSKATKQNPPTNHHIECQSIKDRLTFKQDGGGINDTWRDPSQKAQLLREYRKYDCENKD
jgi:PBP1b-binding outer membrane lipoprotein LpoB